MTDDAADTASEHEPVLKDEVLNNLLHDSDGTYIDATFGRGGHTRALLASLSDVARVVGLDRDPSAVAAGHSLAQSDSRFEILHARFSELASVAAALERPIAGVLLDLGVSSPQLDQGERGFSFRLDGPLDMRMDPSDESSESAADWLNSAAVEEIAEVLFRLGEERHSRRIARAIARDRPLTTTQALADTIAGAVPRRAGAKHPATRSFQAIRMHVNSEVEELDLGLAGAFAALDDGGRLAVISFHSLEDRAVKRAFRALTKAPELPRRLPVRDADVARAMPARHVAGPIRAGAAEVERNPRARSATLRVIEKTAVPSG